MRIGDADIRTEPRGHSKNDGMISRQQTVFELCQLLNDAYAKDKKAVLALLNLRTECNQELADDEDITCTTDEKPKIGIMGVVNGLCNRLDSGYLIAATDFFGEFQGFVVVDRDSKRVVLPSPDFCKSNKARKSRKAKKNGQES